MSKKLKIWIANGLLFVLTVAGVLQYISSNGAYQRVLDDGPKVWAASHPYGPGWVEELDRLGRVIVKVELVIYVLVAINLIVLAVFIVKRRQAMLDKKRLMTRKSIADLTQEQLYDAIGQVYCDNCASTRPCKFIREERIQSFDMLILECEVCGSEVKKRRDQVKSLQ